MRAPYPSSLVLMATLAAVAGAAPAGAQAPEPKPPHVLVTDGDGFVSRLGPVRVNTRTASLSGAYRSFGRPSSSSGRKTLRRVRWRTAGVSIVATTLGGCRRSTCRTSELKIQTSRVTGPRWQTAAGLKVGDPMARIDELYADATAPADGDGNVPVVEAFFPYGDGSTAPTVTARVRGSVVTGFDVFVGGAGE